MKPFVSLMYFSLLIAPYACRETAGPSSGGDSPGVLPVAWKNALGSLNAGYSAWLGGIPAVSNGQLFVEDQNHVVALDAATGTVHWSTEVKSYPSPASSNLVVGGGAVIVAEADIQALEASTGALRWRFHPDSFPEAIATADQDTYYTGQRYYPVVYALDLGNGSLRWRTNVGTGWPYAGFVRGVSVSGDTVYAGVVRYQAANGYLQSGVVVALDRGTGRELWRYETPQPGHDVTWAPIVVGNLLVLDDLFGHGLFAIDRFNPASGERWRITSPNQGAGPATQSVVSNGTVFAATGGGYAYAIDAATGKMIWQQQTKMIAFGVGVCNGSPYVNTGDLEQRDRSSGAQIRSLNAGGQSSFASGLISDDKRIYVTGHTGVVAVTCR